MHTKTELLELLQTHHIRLTKRLGQSYLVNPQTTARLVELCQFSATDRVVEIGAGLGALTVPLAQAVRQVVALEVDEQVTEVLRTRVAAYPGVEVQCQDVLTVDWARYAGWKVAGMIPYHITSPILVALSEMKKLGGIWLGVQREVAQRLAASPGTKAYGRLTVLAQYRWNVSVLATISRQQFFPIPKVELWHHTLHVQRVVEVGYYLACLVACGKNVLDYSKECTQVAVVPPCLGGLPRARRA